MKSSSGVTARTRSARCHERSSTESHSPKVANHDVALQKPRPLHGETHLPGAPASCICTIQLIDLASPIKSPALNCLERPQAGTSRVLRRRTGLAAVRGVPLPKPSVSAPRKRFASHARSPRYTNVSGMHLQPFEPPQHPLCESPRL